MNELITEDTKAILLLCGIFGQKRTEKPLAQNEYNKVVRWLVEERLRPADLLDPAMLQQAAEGTGLDALRMKALIERGVALGFAVEEWQRSGLWVLSRSDADYPSRYKKHLKEKAPPLLFGAGARSLLRGGAVLLLSDPEMWMPSESSLQGRLRHSALNKICRLFREGHAALISLLCRRRMKPVAV